MVHFKVWPSRRNNMLLSRVFPNMDEQTETQYWLWKWKRGQATQVELKFFYVLLKYTAQDCWTQSEWMYEWGVAGPGELWPPARGGGVNPSIHYNNRGVEMSGAVRTSDDRARRMVTRTTRKDKPDEEKREMRWVGGGDMNGQRAKKKRWKQIWD